MTVYKVFTNAFISNVFHLLTVGLGVPRPECRGPTLELIQWFEET